MHRLLPLAVLLTLLALVPAAQAHGPAPKGLSEGALRAWESDFLGGTHAAEHALQRKLARDPRQRARIARERRRARASADGPAGEIGRWTSRFDIPVMGINAAMLPTGKVLWYAYPNHPDFAPAKAEAWAVLWDPAKGEGPEAFKRVNPPIDPATGKPANIWCSGTSFLADGRVLVTGGNAEYYQSATQRWKGLDQVYTFNPWSESWTRQPDMEQGRWYPSQLLMPDGRSLILQGEGEKRDGSKNTDVEVFTPSADLNGRGRIDLIGQLPVVGDYYPHLFWMPSGRALLAGPFRNDSWYFDGPGAGPRAPVQSTDVPDLQRRRVWGTAVLEPGSPSAVLQIGGSDTGPNYNEAPATATTERFVEGAAAWTREADLNVGRGHHNTVLLPDGSMVTVGGGVGSGGSSACGPRARRTSRSSSGTPARRRGASGRRRRRTARTTRPRSCSPTAESCRRATTSTAA